MSDVSRETLEVDVLFVGAGPACLAGALHLANLVKQHDEAIDRAERQGTKLGEISIAVIEKGSEVGMHSLSGAVLDPRALRELMPDFESRGWFGTFAPRGTPEPMRPGRASARRPEAAAHSPAR